MRNEIIHAQAGEHIDAFTEKLVSHWEYLATKINDKELTVSGDFNGVTLTATGKETPEMLQKHFSVEMNKQVEEYRNSDEYKAQEERRSKEVIELQKKHDALIASIPNHDFKDYGATLDLVYRYYEVTDHVGVQKNHGSFIETLEKNGYLPNANTGSQFKKDDPENHARYLIGQFMSCTKSMGACPPVMDSFYKEYVKMFRKTEPSIA